MREVPNWKIFPYQGDNLSKEIDQSEQLYPETWRKPIPFKCQSNRQKQQSFAEV